MKGALEVTKGFFDLLKQVAIVAVIALLFVNPSGVGHTLEKVGITEGDLFGLKWKTNFLKTDAQFQQALADKDQLSERLKQTNGILTQFVALEHSAPLITDSRITGLLASAKAALGQNTSTVDASQQNTQAAQQTVINNTPLAARADTADTRAASQWVVLTGSDKTEDAANDEINRARRAGFQNAKIIHNRGVFRTGLVYDDRESAVTALPAAKVVRGDAYLVSMEKWCPRPREVRADFLECSP
jgi:hypothetical protein